MATGKFLIQEGTNTVYVWSETLAKRKDMRPYDPESKGRVVEGLTPHRPTVAIELQGKTFQVETELHAVLLEMGNVMVELQEANKALLDEKSAWEVQKERLTTDVADLEEQLAKDKEEIAVFDGQPEITATADQAVAEGDGGKKRSRSKAE